MFSYQDIAQAIRDGADRSDVEAMLRDEHAAVTDEQIAMLRAMLDERGAAEDA